MAQYKIANYIVSPTDEGFQALLGEVYKYDVRPLCMCKEPGLEMYIARVGDNYILKRMPNSGDQHTEECDSYEAPVELSGLAEVMGSAIQHAQDGTTTLKLDFSLSKKGGPPINRGAVAQEKSSVRTDGSRLTLRGLLHHLWETAKLNRWYPAMAGKRNWFVVHRHLLKAADGQKIKGGNKALLEALYIPEPFMAERKDEIARRRVATLARVAGLDKGSHEMLVMIAEVKDIVPGRVGGYKLIAKQVPDFGFLMDAKLYGRFMKRFNDEWNLFKALEQSHLLVAATVAVDQTGIATIDEISAMVVNENWIPFETKYEYDIITGLRDTKRAFLKVLRYNLASNEPIASILLLDTDSPDVPMYIVPKHLAENEEFRKTLDEYAKPDAWKYFVTEEMPPIPPMRTSLFAAQERLAAASEAMSAPQPPTARQDARNAVPAPVPAQPAEFSGTPISETDITEMPL